MLINAINALWWLNWFVSNDGSKKYGMQPKKWMVFELGWGYIPKSYQTWWEANNHKTKESSRTFIFVSESPRNEKEWLVTRRLETFYVCKHIEATHLQQSNLSGAWWIPFLSTAPHTPSVQLPRVARRSFQHWMAAALAPCWLPVDHEEQFQS